MVSHSLWLCHTRMTLAAPQLKLENKTKTPSNFTKTKKLKQKLDFHRNYTKLHWLWLWHRDDLCSTETSSDADVDNGLRDIDNGLRKKNNANGVVQFDRKLYGLDVMVFIDIDWSLHFSISSKWPKWLSLTFTLLHAVKLTLWGYFLLRW